GHPTRRSGMSSTRCGRHAPIATRRSVRPTPWACPRWRCRTSADRSWVDSLASLGWGDDPHTPPSVGVPASSAGRARPSTRTVRGSRQVVAYHLPPTTYHLLPRDFRLTELRCGLG